MAEYIERETLISALESEFEDNENCRLFVSEIPTADVVEVRHGHWFIVEYEYFTCSECGNSFYNGCESTAEAKQRLKDGLYYSYCGHCGAKMDGKDGAE